MRRAPAIRARPPVGLRPLRAAAYLAELAPLSCDKVPIYDVNAGFLIADVSWFEDEETLFVFYEVEAEQGIGETSEIEITYLTDDGRVDWTPLSELEMVHTHEVMDCGEDTVCGSASLHVPREPRGAAIRLLYHRDGELALDVDTVFNVVSTGPAHSNRSMVVYGVFDEDNEQIQWRGRHTFPTIRNGDATRLGLRRAIEIDDQRFGGDAADDGVFTDAQNPYGYGVDCPDDFEAADLGPLAFDDRAAFHEELLPQAAADAASVCAQATVWDATGAFTTAAVARKNPEVRPAFELMRSPIYEATELKFFLAPCEEELYPEHEAMQRQRLFMEDTPTRCVDGWGQEGFVEALAADFSDAVEAARADGEDMVLLVGLHREDSGVAEAVEEALAMVVPEDRHKSTPRLAGAFVFDSAPRSTSGSAISQTTLWCPSTLPSAADTVPSASSVTCPILTSEDVELGPLTFGALPILPSRNQYFEFLDTYSENQTGEMLSLRFQVPEFATTSDHVDLGDYGAVTFLNGEQISADEDDAFSYCADEESGYFIFRSETLQSEEFAALLAENCEELGLSEDFCGLATLGLLTVNYLPFWHNNLPEDSYDLGIYWEFPFLLQAEYEAVTAGSVGAFGFSVPFGFAATGESYLGSQIWTREEHSLDPLLLQCRRFCEHPTFDIAGVYNVNSPFRETFESTCYEPLYPEPPGSAFPQDP